MNHMESQSYRVSANDLFAQIKELLDQSSKFFAEQNSLHTPPSTLLETTIHRILVLACHEAIRDTNQAYGNLFSQVDYLCKKHHVSISDRIAIQTMRRHSNRHEPLSYDELMYDIRALSLFISTVFQVAIPHEIVTRIPATNRLPDTQSEKRYDYLRCIVQEWNEEVITATTGEEETTDVVLIDYTAEHLHYLKDVLQEGMQLNLLEVRKEEERLIPSLIVVEPDFLIDISSIARCFEKFGHHPLMYTLNRMAPSAVSQAILLGHFASKSLDDTINDESSTLNTTIMKCFKQKALDFCTCPDFNSDQFLEDAKRQTANIQEAVQTLFEENNRDKAILEPSFVCERLGITGRVDLMTTDGKLLVEQKSGKNFFIETGHPDEHGSMMLEPNYVQLLLYFGVLRQNFHLGTDQTDIRLLYSKYPARHGLVVVNFFQKLFHEAIQLRNLIVTWELYIARYGFESVIDLIRPETVNVKQLNNDFYKRWKLPTLQRICAPLHGLSPLERAYYCTMMTFVYREQRVSKLGAQEGISRCGADLWNMPLHEKREVGDIFVGLQLLKKEKSAEYNGFDTLTLSVPDQGDDFLPNFRPGDMVYLYAYPEGTEPDVRKSILFKGTLQHIQSDAVTVILSDGQQNPDIFSSTLLRPHSTFHIPHSTLYAIEHASSDMSGSAIRSLHTFISAPQECRDLLLGQRKPQTDTSRTLSHSYHPDYDEVLLRAKQANDYFLITGPPGTGKTSMALRFLVEEELIDSRASILLMAYTNRAVDEICSMLADSHHDFIRIGSAHRCDPRFHGNLIANIIEQNPRLEAISGRILQTPIIVGTTATLLGHPELFNLRSFSLAVIDEASQILEPDIIGLLAAHVNGQNCINRFILIGDHKQLPAVVQQEEKDSRTDHSLLHAIGLTDCRQSLFERLLRIAPDSVKGVLHKQGRMHPAIADFPCKMFYPNEHLKPVPLPHQQEPANANLQFIPSEFCKNAGLSDKVNTDEARIVAEQLKRIYEENSESFNPNTTVGVIVPYRNQIAVIRREIEKLNIPALMEISIDTVERYQGSQRDVIIFSFTIQNPYQLEFLTANCFMETDDDGSTRIIDRKLNVVLTRARKQLIITGNPRILAINPLFRDLMRFLSA
jgi:hypothetical protein